MCECVLTCPGRSCRCFGNRGQSSLTQLKTKVYRKKGVKEAQQAGKTPPGSDGQITWDWVIWTEEERGKSVRSLGEENCNHPVRWRTLQKDSGAIRRHLHGGISVWSLVWEESSVCAGISGIQMVLLLALAHSCQPPTPSCCGVYQDSNMNCYTGDKCTTHLP